MSTRAMIVMEIDNGVYYSGIYCHSSGGIDDCGKILDKHYQSPDKINSLMAFGHISSLSESVYDLRPNREKECGLYTDSLETIMNQYHHYYTYLYEDGEWFVNRFNKTNWQKLKEALKGLI
jgi:hypothetical protein